MSLFKSFATDSKIENEGILFTCLGPDGKPVFRVRLARMGGSNERFDKVRERVMGPYRKVHGQLTQKVRDELAQRVFAEAGALPGTWAMYEREGLKCKGNEFKKNDSGELAWSPSIPAERGEDGFVKGIDLKDEVVRDTVENVTKVFAELPELYAMLATEALNADSYRVDVEADAKN